MRGLRVYFRVCERGPELPGAVGGVERFVDGGEGFWGRIVGAEGGAGGY